MILANVDEVILATENHTVLKLAGIQFPERLGVLESRREQLGGMIELARRIRLDRRLERWLEAHREMLRREIDGDD